MWYERKKQTENAENDTNKMAGLMKIARKSRNRRIRRSVAFGLIAAVVFTSVYAMILPALTLDSDTAKDVIITEETQEVSVTELSTDLTETAPETAAPDNPDPAATEAPIESAASEEASPEPAVAEETAATETASIVSAGDIAPEIPTETEAPSDNTDIAAAEPAAPSDAETTAAEENLSETVYNDITLKEEGKDYTVTVEAPAAAKIPAQAKLAVKEIEKDSEEYASYLSEARKALKLEDDEALPSYAARFFDIKIMNGADEIEPAAAVKVEISLLDENINKAEDLQVIHEVEEGKIETPKVETALIDKNGEKENVTEADSVGLSASFDAESFSIYGVVYTVDFETVSGGVYSIAGGSSILLSQLASEIGLAAVGYVKEEVAEVSFSNPALVAVSAVEGDWVLQSLQAFDTVENLAITMKNGDVVTVKVTDQNSDITSYIIGASISGNSSGSGVTVDGDNWRLDDPDGNY